MAVTLDEVRAALGRVVLPGGGSLGESGLVRALAVSEGAVRFVIEAPDAGAARALGGCATRPRPRCGRCPAWPPPASS
jgi:ATP-binding protein involved in chromosome partitioning